MINKLLQGLIKLIIGLVNIVLLPIDTLIKSALPDVSLALSKVGDILNIISNSIGWAISVSGLSSTALSIIVMYFTFKLTVPILFSSIKMAVKWYDKLKP